MGVIMYNGVQYTGAGGGGGDVEDVYVNGTSVLDSNKIAQVKSYMELTESQYNALPASKLSDGILYCISDIDYEDRNYFNPIIYSTEEREIGVWYDNKPLYQKTIISTTTPSQNTWTTITLDLPTDAFVTKYEAYYRRSSNRMDFIPQYNPTGSDDWLFGALSNNNFVYKVSSPYITNFLETYITVWYTKTTDTPGSGSYNTLGVPNVHYSTDEQVIGTWIDGRPIYMKCFQLSNYQLVRNVWTTINDVEVPNIDDVVEITVSGYDTDNQYPALGGLLSMRFNGDKLQYFLNIDFPIYVKTIILRYTKTTD